MKTSNPVSTEHAVKIIVADGVTLEGHLSIPDGARGLVVFVHGSGSSRFSPRNRYVALGLKEGGLATLLLDLLTAEEERIDERTRQFRFDIDLLARRVVGVTDWLLGQSETRNLCIGYFGSSTGAAAALIAAAERSNVVSAVVSRGGRPDLAMPVLGRVRAPTLFIVGSNDTAVIALNNEALAQLFSEKKMEIVHGASHLFGEPGALEKVVVLAREWFQCYLASEEEYQKAV